VLQGWELPDYIRCVDLYRSAGVDPAALPRVGLGSVCRRQSTGQIADIVITLANLGLNLHGFGVKTGGLHKYGYRLSSADCLCLYPINCCWWVWLPRFRRMRITYLPGTWIAFHYDLERPQTPVDSLTRDHEGALRGMPRGGRRHERDDDLHAARAANSWPA
jgi:hypothetical protein